jgi:MoaA/NifB/PqqE/SkfB family radical SAM enzyme
MQLQESIDVLREEEGTTSIGPIAGGTDIISSGFRKWRVKAGIKGALLRAALRSADGRPLRALSLLRSLARRRREYFGHAVITKYAHVAGRYYWTMEAPGWPGPAVHTMLGTELSRVAATGTLPGGPRIAFLSITKKCPLDCEHCYDWHNHNGHNDMPLADLIRTTELLQGRMASQIFLSGGEPLARYPDLVRLLEAARPGTDFWILTSGYKLTQDRASGLRKAGLTGVSVSLDHFEPHLHNRFRGMNDSFEWVTRSVKHAHQAGLAVALSLCATKEFTTQDNLRAYADLGRRLGVAFIQVLEPRQVGRYEREDVSLSPEQHQLLETFYHELNFDERYADWPIISYPGVHQRKLGCSGAGDRFLYIDADGDIHACPFCHTSKGNILEDDFDDALAGLKARGCLAYPSAKA